MSEQGFNTGGAAKKVGGMANVQYGAYGQPGPYAGRTIADVKADLSVAWGLPADATAKKGKENLADDYVIETGDQIVFQRRLGEKGA